MNPDNEIWKDVVGYEGYYEVSNLLRIRRGKIGSNVTKTGTIIKQRVDHYGYLCVDLWNKCKQKRPRVHSLYMSSFVGPRNGQDIRHLDDNKLNNVPENLRYGTRSENLLDDYKNNPNRKNGFRIEESHRRAIKNRIESNKRKINEANNH